MSRRLPNRPVRLRTTAVIVAAALAAACSGGGGGPTTSVPPTPTPTPDARRARAAHTPAGVPDPRAHAGGLDLPQAAGTPCPRRSISPLPRLVPPPTSQQQPQMPQTHVAGGPMPSAANSSVRVRGPQLPQPQYHNNIYPHYSPTYHGFLAAPGIDWPFDKLYGPDLPQYCSCAGSVRHRRNRRVYRRAGRWRRKAPGPARRRMTNLGSRPLRTGAFLSTGRVHRPRVFAEYRLLDRTRVIACHSFVRGCLNNPGGLARP